MGKRVEQTSKRHGREGGEPDQLPCCPDCDDAQIKLKGARSMKRSDQERPPKYRCQACGHEFDDPETRAPKSTRASHGQVATPLVEADPDASIRELMGGSE